MKEHTLSSVFFPKKVSIKSNDPCMECNVLPVTAQLVRCVGGFSGDGNGEFGALTGSHGESSGSSSALREKIRQYYVILLS